MKKLTLALAALLPFTSPAGFIVDSTGVMSEGRFTFTADKGLVFAPPGAAGTTIQPGNFRALEFSAVDAIWPEDFRKSGKVEAGLLGTYFEGTKLATRKHERVDRDIDFNWGSGSPFKNWWKEDFSVRWTGSFKVQRTGDYQFITTSDDGVRLSVNGKQLIDNWTDHSVIENKTKVRLEKDRENSIRIEYFENSGEAIMRVEYIDPSKARRKLSELRLAPPAGVAAGNPDLPQLVRTGLKPGVILRDGSYLSTQIKQANDTAVVLGKPYDGLTISTFNVARVVFREIPPDTAARATARRQGALLVGGDFVDGEFKSFERGMLKLSSLLFGLQSLETKFETHALMLREPKFDESNWRVRDCRGNVVLAEKLQFDGDEVVINSPVLKEFRLPLSSVYRIDSGTGSDLFPAALEFGPESVHANSRARSDDEIRRQKDSARKNSAREKMYRQRDASKEQDRMAKEDDDAAYASKKTEELEKKVAGYREQFVKAEKDWKAASAKYDELYKKYNQSIADQRTKSRAYDLAKGAEGRANSNQKNLYNSLGSLRGQLNRNNRNRSEAQTKKLKSSLADTEKKYNTAKEAYAAAGKKSRDAATAKSDAYRLAGKLRSESSRAKSERDGKYRTLSSRKKSLSTYESQLRTARSRLASAVAKVESRKDTELR
ncbi:MAG: PA14 domain-containing protein [Limisphaerales bacterium]